MLHSMMVFYGLVAALIAVNVFGDLTRTPIASFRARPRRWRPFIGT